MQSTADQILTKTAGWTTAVPAAVYAIPKTGACSVACAGGIYGTASKAAPIYGPASLTWVTLDSAASPPVYVAYSGALAAGGAQLNKLVMNTAQAYVSLTTGSTAACTADFEIWGYVLT